MTLSPLDRSGPSRDGTDTASRPRRQYTSDPRGNWSSLPRLPQPSHRRRRAGGANQAGAQVAHRIHAVVGSLVLDILRGLTVAVQLAPIRAELIAQAPARLEHLQSLLEQRLRHPVDPGFYVSDGR